ncbi:melanocyte-stimulating hormone receptor-like [Oculina patagonica]
MLDFAIDGNYTSRLNETSTSTIGRPRHAFISALNIFLAITASVGNSIIIIALHKVTTLHPPTKLLFRCLAVTDLCVGLITQPLYAIAVMPQGAMNRDILKYFITGNYVSSYMLCGVSALISTAISVDRLLALLLRMRYRNVVTLRRVRAVVICCWLIGVSCGLMYLWSITLTWIVVFIFLMLCLVISIFSYAKIYLKLRQHQNQIQEHVHQGQPNGGEIPLNIARYKKTVSSIAWVQLTLVACYVPYGIESLLWIRGIDTYNSWLSTATLVYLNSSLNPILYCWKMREVRQTVKDTIGQFCCFSS